MTNTRIAPGFPFSVVINETTTAVRMAPGVCFNEQSKIIAAIISILQAVNRGSTF